MSLKSLNNVSHYYYYYLCGVFSSSSPSLLNPSLPLDAYILSLIFPSLLSFPLPPSWRIYMRMDERERERERERVLKGVCASERWAFIGRERGGEDMLSCYWLDALAAGGVWGDVAVTTFLPPPPSSSSLFFRSLFTCFLVPYLGILPGWSFPMSHTLINDKVDVDVYG